MLKTLARWFAAAPSTPPSVPAFDPDPLVTRRSEVLAELVTDLGRRVEKLERSEAERSMEHAAMLDRMDRLYRRIAARMVREAQLQQEPDLTGPTDTGESALEMRKRLRGR